MLDNGPTCEHCIHKDICMCKNTIERAFDKFPFKPTSTSADKEGTVYELDGDFRGMSHALFKVVGEDCSRYMSILDCTGHSTL